MDTTDPIWRSPAVQQAAAAGQFGALIRMTRTARRLSLARVGHLVRYSASTLSRIETGQRKLVDVTELRMFADTLGIPPHLFGLTSTSTPVAGRAAAPTLLPVPTTVCQTGEGGDDALHRRQLLAGLVGVTGVALLGPSTQPAIAAAAPTADAHLQTLLDGPQRVVGQPASVPILRTRLADARATYEACRYHDLAVSLPEVIATAQTSLDEATGQRHEQTAAVLADAYSLAADLCSRLHDDALSWVTAERARSAAHLSGNPASIAEAARMTSIALRRHGHHETATTLLTGTALDLGADVGNPCPERLAAYGALLCTAAYTAAQQNSRHQALDLISEAETAATRLGDTHVPGNAFSATNASIYRIGVHTALGDPGTALDHARKITLRSIATPERQARFCLDTARAWERFGSPTNCVNALHVAERCAPEELHRSSVRSMVVSLLEAPGP
ncbi:MAG: helix-turn-helix domain-containing protein, partial [Pseudonocardiaceae bacterium]